jgi:ferredoxin
MANVTFANWSRTVKAGPLSTLRKVAQLAGISLYTGLSKAVNCHGVGLCGTCKVHVEPSTALTPPTQREKLRKCTGPMRLACQTRVLDDVTVIKMDGKEPLRVKGVAPVATPPMPAPVST